MKIEGTPKSVGGTVGDVKARATREQSAAKVDTAGTSKVELSGLSQLGGELASVPEIDSAKVGELKQAIAEGRFKVNPDKVADGLIDSVRQMLSAQPQRA
jgi:negative regulator of flagellin synthesis FlgM